MLQSVLNPFLGRRRGLKAALSGVNGFTGAGEVAYSVSIYGEIFLTVRLRGVAGRKAELFSDDAPIVAVPVSNGRAGKRFTSRDGAAIPEIEEGETIEVRQNGHVILSGVFNRA